MGDYPEMPNRTPCPKVRASSSLYAQNLLSSAVVIRPLHGEPPTIDLVMGYNRSNTSALLKRFLSRADELVARVSQNQGSRLFAAQ
jgi:LysR family hca operon transcriptional activator